MATIAPYIQSLTVHEKIGLVAARWNPTFSFEQLHIKGAMGRIGDAAIGGGMVLASPCGVCQAGVCGPEVLAPCASLFASGAAIGAVVGIGSELIGSGFSAKAWQAGIPTAAAVEIAPRIERSSQAALNQQHLLRSFLDEIEHRRPGKATYDWKAGERVRIPRNLDTHSTASWTVIPREAGQSERSDAGVGFYSGRPLLIKFSAS